MYLKKITGISLIALGAMSPLRAEIDTALSVQGPEILTDKIKAQRNAVKVSEDQFKQLVGRLIRQGALVPIDALVVNKTAEYVNSWTEVKTLHSAYEAAQSGFASAKDEPASVKALREQLAAKQAEYDALEDNDNSASLENKLNAGKIQGKISALEGENEDLDATLKAYRRMDSATKGKIIGLQGKAKRAKGSAADRYADLIQSKEELLSQISVKITKTQQEIKNNETDIQKLKAESEGNSSLSARAEGLREKRFAKQLVKKEIQRIKADLKKALGEYSTGRINKKAVKKALHDVVVSYTQFVQQFVGAEQGAQNCLEKCTEMLLTKTEDALTKPTGTCSVGGIAPGTSSEDLDDESAASAPGEDPIGNDKALSIYKGDAEVAKSAVTPDASKSEEISAFSAEVLDALTEAREPENHTLEMKSKLEDLDAKFQEMRNLADEISDSGRSGPYVRERRLLLARGMQLRNVLADFKVAEDDAVPAVDDLDSPVLAIEGPKAVASDKDEPALDGDSADVDTPLLAIEGPKAAASDEVEPALDGDSADVDTPLLAIEGPKAAASDEVEPALDGDSADVDSPVLAIEGPKAVASDEDEPALQTRKMTRKEEALMSRVGQVISATKKNKFKALANVELHKNCEQIKELAKDSSLTPNQRVKFVCFLKFDAVKKQCR